MSDRDDLRYYGLYSLVAVKATGRIGLYTGSVHAPAEKGGDLLDVRFDDGSEWRYRPAELKKAKPPNRIFDTEHYRFTKAAPEKWRKVWQEWDGENAVCQLMSTLRMYAERQLAPGCWADEEGLLGVVRDVWLGQGCYGHIDRYTRERLRLAWQLTFHEDLPPDDEIDRYIDEVAPAMEAHREAYFRERDASQRHEAQERVMTAVASGRYEGSPAQFMLPGLD